MQPQQEVCTDSNPRKRGKCMTAGSSPPPALGTISPDQNKPSAGFGHFGLLYRIPSAFPLALNQVCLFLCVSFGFERDVNSGLMNASVPDMMISAMACSTGLSFRKPWDLSHELQCYIPPSHRPSICLLFHSLHLFCICHHVVLGSLSFGLEPIGSSKDRYV